MRNFFIGIAAVFAFALIGCEDTTTTAESTSDTTQGVTFTGVTDNETTPVETTTVETNETTETQTETETNPTEVEENNETNTVPEETEETTPEQQGSNSSDPVEEQIVEEENIEVDPTEDEITLEDLTADDLAEIEILRDNIFGGLSVGKELYLDQVSLALEDLGIDGGYQVSDESQELPEVSDCPYVEFYNNQAVMTGFACEYLVDKARSEAYSKLYGTLASVREAYDPEFSEEDFWFEQGAVSGLEEARVIVRVDLKAKQICNVNPSPVKSSEEKGQVVGRQHFINSMNNWLTTNGYSGDYPVMSDPIEVCQASESMLDPVFDDAMNTISQAMEQNPLCDDYVPTSSDDEIMFAQAQTDYSKALKVGIEDEFALAAVKVFKVIPCNVSDPIILDLNGNGVFDITRVERGVNFAMTGKRATATSWLMGDGFLFNDANGNGIVDNGTEFFGTTGQVAFDQLAAFDTNKDNQITPDDAGYSRLFVWQDTNYDGVSLTTEVFPLSHFNITSIPLQTTEYQKVVNGSRVKTTVKATTSTSQVMLFGDVDFRAGIYHSPAIYRQTQTPMK